MADDNPPWFAADHKPTKAERPARPTTRIWTLLRIAGDRTESFTCELVEGAPIGAELRILRNGELYRSELAADPTSARRVADTYKQAALAPGWMDLATARGA
jgi:hypothetical protein